MIGIYNIFVYKIPVFDPETPVDSPKLRTYDMHPVNFTDIAIDDPIRKNLVTEDQAWHRTWAYLHDKEGFKVFLPMEKKFVGLERVIDDKGNQYMVWRFSTMQMKREFLIFPSFTLGGETFIDAYDGQVLWHAGFL